jgi:Metallo-peptidase family M12
MKKLSLLFVIGLAFAVFYLLRFEPSKAQNNTTDEGLRPTFPRLLAKPAEELKEVPQIVRNSKLAGIAFERRELFESTTRNVSSGTQFREVLNEGVLLDLNKQAIQTLINENVGFLTLPLPNGNGEVIELELVKVDIFGEGFSVKTSKPTSEQIDKSLGVHYRGIVKGNDHSLAAISIFKNEVMGFFSTESAGNSVIGRLSGKNRTDKHILYVERDLKVSSNFHCDTNDDGVILPESFLQKPEEVLARCVRIYIEANYDLFLNKGSVSNTTSYLSGMFNQSSALYSNEGIPISISEFFVWNSPSPYTGADSTQVLNQFTANRTSFTGDLAHLVSLQNYGGKASGIGNFCTRANAYAFSGIFANYSNVPTYSWTVNVFTHETGHNLGSRHTHACVWNGNNTAIRLRPSARFSL